jgi:hypothetical protein
MQFLTILTFLFRSKWELTSMKQQQAMAGSRATQWTEADEQALCSACDDVAVGAAFFRAK